MLEHMLINVLKNHFIGARAFVRSSKEDTPIVIYADPISEKNTSTTNILKQYKDFKECRSTVHIIFGRCIFKEECHYTSRASFI